MLRLGFTRFLISEPPFHAHVPLVGRCNKWGLFDHNSSDAIKTRIRENLMTLRDNHPENVRIFKQMCHLGDITHDEHSYIDPVHAGQQVHDELTLKAVEQLKKSGWDDWK